MPLNDSTTTSGARSPADLPSHRGETWNDTEAINRHRALAPSDRVRLAIEASRAALLFAHAGRVIDVPPIFEPDRIVAALNRADVAYVLVGGIAGAAHGVVRASADLDLVPERSASNLDRLANTLAELGAADASLTECRTRHADVHVLNRALGVPAAAELRAHAITVDLGPDARALICSRADFRAMKLALGRPRDLVDVAELDELHGER